SESLLKEIENEMLTYGSGHAYFCGDLMQHGEPTRLAGQVNSVFGGFDIVVHAVGGPLDIRDPLSPVDEWQRVWQYNCGIAIEMNCVLIPCMQQRNWGRVIHISSISGVLLRGAAPYASAKAYLNAYTKTLGRELAKSGVVVSAVLPGAVAFDGSYWDKFVKEMHPRVDDFLRHHQAAGRMGTPEEIASFVVMLGSEQASFAQGALFNVDGGNM
ncbi:MAG: SDR family oxidoreductase, partial [Planctomycetaceae bacterium]|nr:SDR family oxidoreductase [Planctomycetaceae bacterium]